MVLSLHEKWNEKESARRIMFTAELLEKTNGKLLDIGAYKGELNWHLENIEYYPLDIHDLTDVFDKAEHVDLNKTLGLLPYEDDFFDYAVCIGTLEHLFYPEKVIIEIKRVLKPKGVAILSFPNDNSLYMKILQLFNNIDVPFDELKYLHHWFFGRNCIRNLLAKHFNIIKEKGYAGIYTRFLLPRFILNRFPNMSPELFYRVENVKHD